MSLLRRYAMALLCGLFALGFGAASLLSAGLVERLFYLLGCVINAVLFGSWWAIERTFPHRERAADLFTAAAQLMSVLEEGRAFSLNGRLWIPHACPDHLLHNPPADTGEEGHGT